MALQTRFDFALPRLADTPERPNIARAHKVAEQLRFPERDEITDDGDLLDDID